jgi:hypothetical protein|nr:MAG TPA: putative head-tail adaptor [Caudoviricetes sp.]DAU72605.1 MAG TPA: putative head-tail adaptor [Caudoviricetes sp.]
MRSGYLYTELIFEESRAKEHAFGGGDLEWVEAFKTRGFERHKTGNLSVLDDEIYQSVIVQFELHYYNRTRVKPYMRLRRRGELFRITDIEENRIEKKIVITAERSHE